MEAAPLGAAFLSHDREDYCHREFAVLVDFDLVDAGLG
jgi:hypothetical protein